MKCNCCGKSIQDNGQEDYLVINKQWGFFSGKDLEQHQFVVCEPCYDEWVRHFVYPPQIDDYNVG